MPKPPEHLGLADLGQLTLQFLPVSVSAPEEFIPLPIDVLDCLFWSTEGCEEVDCLRGKDCFNQSQAICWVNLASVPKSELADRFVYQRLEIHTL